MAGRKTKLTPNRQRTICEVMRDGGTYAAAAAQAGICESTLHDWRRYGAEEESGIYRDLVDALDRAIAEGEAIAVRQVFASFTEPTVETVEETLSDGSSKTKTITRPPDASMALKWLERRSPQRWNIPHRLAVGQDPDAEPVVVFYLPHNERDVDTPKDGAPDGGAPGAVPAGDDPEAETSSTE